MTEEQQGRVRPGRVFNPLPGSQRAELQIDDGSIRATLVLRRCRTRERLYDHPDWSRIPQERKHEWSTDAHHAIEEEIGRVATWAEERGLEVVEQSIPKRTVVVQGSPKVLSAALGIRFVGYRHERGDHRGFEGQIKLPGELDDVVEAVLGLHTRPLARPWIVQAAGEAATVLQATDLEGIYRFPTGTDGAGQRIGLIQLGGGYYPDDLKEFFDSLHLPVPKIRDVGVAGARRQPESRDEVQAFIAWLRATLADPSSASPPPAAGPSTLEVTMDIELAGALAPAAELMVYFAPNTDQGLFDALHAALEDNLNVISCSWSWDESGEAVEGLIDDLLERCALEGVTFFVCSGDRGATGEEPSGPAELNPQFPATSPWACGCGGTSLKRKPDTRWTESAWNTPALRQSTGGGVSTLNRQPRWQRGRGVPRTPAGATGRGVPDVASVADPQTHCRILVAGEWLRAGGTSASAPLWAALVARLNQAIGKPLGYLNPLLYRLAEAQPAVLNDVVAGSNGFYKAGEGWDACTGLGTPVGEQLLSALRGENPNHALEVVPFQRKPQG